MFKINSVRLACLAILFAFTVACVGNQALAQSAVTGAVGGTATDQNNAAVASATVTLRSMDTNKTETMTTDSEGRFRFSNLQPGAYAITITAGGFSEFKIEQLAVEVGRLSAIDAVLRVGAASVAAPPTAPATADCASAMLPAQANVNAKRIARHARRTVLILNICLPL